MKLAVATRVVLASALLVSAAACTTAPSPPRAAAVVWLCRPGLPAGSDPCVGSLDATVVPGHGPRAIQRVTAKPTPFDCFYVHPSVSSQTTPNASLTIEPADIGVAETQAQPFSRLCRVFAPMYRQRTMASAVNGLAADPRATTIAYDSVLAAWQDYLRHYNDGRPIIFIGHSEGAAMLIRLLETQVDPDPALRVRTVVAILAGGNVAVPIGKLAGATFRHLPLCTAAAQTGCVIAYSTFPRQPPPGSHFGYPGQGISIMSGQTAATGLQVACVNPAALGGGTADLSPYFLAVNSPTPGPPVRTPWVTYPRLYSASCQTAGGATWLQVTRIAARGDQRPAVTEPDGPAQGYHRWDISLALGNLLADVTQEEAAYTRHH
jgi:hypothetical protein